VTEQEALAELRRIKNAYQTFIRDNFESAAQDCSTCPTFGACCTDAHFVNVHITRLEAVAIKESIENHPNLTAKEKQAVFVRAANAIEKYDLTDAGDTFNQTFACPLFVQKIGCLVHLNGAKPAPCIQHACYENNTDLPPDCLQDSIESKIEKLNRAVYGENSRWLPLPIWLNLESLK
jgi:hypothetical protein